jgi:hypothetical protein
MITRIVTLMFIAVLALPVATLTRPAETSPSPWGEVAVEAKGKKHKHHKKPRYKTVTRTVRQPVTETFTSIDPITIPAVPGGGIAQASPYPAAMSVSGFTNGTITDVNLILTDFTNSFAEDVNVLLSTSDGRRALVMSNVGGTDGFTDISLTLDDEAGAPLPVTALSSGTFRPTDVNLGPNEIAAPAPAPDGNVALSTFDGADPIGTWQLWVMDVGSIDVSDIGGWELQITAEVDVQVEEQVRIKHKNKHKKGKK